MLPLCVRCKGKGLCGKPCPLLQRLDACRAQIGAIKENFSGSAPSVFVGRYGYPNVNVGILSPAAVDKRAWQLDAPSFWYSQSYSIEKVLEARSQLIHPRSIAHIKKPDSKLVTVVQEIAMASKPVSTEFLLKSKPKPMIMLDTRMAPIGAPALLERATLEENPRIPKIVDYIVSDELKAADGMNILYEKGIDVGHITRILSAGLLGMNKRLVPTRWSITATDDSVSKSLLSAIRDFPQLSEYALFSNEYLGNHFEILLMPRDWSFEVIEGAQPSSCWNPSGAHTYVYSDWEPHWGRKTYASNVTGAYYSDRLAVCEYLVKIRRQCSVLIVREVKPDYMMPLGVWVNREAVRGALQARPERFSGLKPALDRIFSRISLSRKDVLAASQLLKEIRQQKTLKAFIG